jgi:hypothetical protein
MSGFWELTITGLCGQTYLVQAHSQWQLRLHSDSQAITRHLHHFYVSQPYFSQ